ncbi:MAG TPA: ABC transporter ATP-binding protein [Acidimicrobiia bacterium]|nr:ABC transporter ATP-binding protein [Acidimicrobiia bacterium]
MPAVLEVTGLRAGYGRTEVLHGVDLRVPAGAAVALLGSNGAGKTTLLKTIAGLLPAREGHVRFQGSPVERRPANARARAGLCLIPEGRGIFRRLTVRENLTMQVGRRHLNGSLEKATARFPKLGQRMDQVAGTLSGGEQQMLALARALVTDPAVVLADELSVGLAPVVVDEIFEALAVLRAEGRSLLLVEQYVERAVGIADYVYILQKGEIVFVGEPSQCASGVVFARYLGASA